MTWKERILWLNAHWYIPFTLFLSAVVYGVFRKGGHATAQQKLDVELAATSAKLQVSAISIQKGTDAAMDHVRQTYQSNLAKLTEGETRAAQKLRDNPAALADFLVRTGAAPGVGSDPKL